MNVKTLKLTARIVISGFFVSVGIHHFIDPTPYLVIMPPYLPAHLELVYISGVFEMLGGLGLLIKRVRMFAGWGLIALLIAVYPANIHMLINEVYLPDMPKEKW
ncbi:MAG: DoxX family protein, partial [Bradymonadia bacterium]